MSRDLRNILIAYVLLFIGLICIDLVTGFGEINWFMNLFIALFIIGIFSLYGGILNLWTKKDRNL